MTAGGGEPSEADTRPAQATEVPYRGLRFFSEKDTHLFFGRDEQIDDLLALLRRSRFVTVIGSSGSGKSSLVQAGLIPGLRSGFLPEAGGRWRVITTKPGGDPLRNLAVELEKTTGLQEVETTLRRGALGLVEAIRQASLPAAENALVLVDQFEELFRFEHDGHAAGNEDGAAFVKLLLEAAYQREVPIYVVLTMRSEFLGDCARFRDLPERINDGLYLVPRMRRDQLDQAITGPARVAGADIDRVLVQRLLNAVGQDPDQLPVLQHALLRTWSHWSTTHGEATRSIALGDFDSVGGLEGGLSRHANEIYDSLSPDQQRIAKVLFQRLIDRDPENRELRHPASITDVAAVANVSPTEVTAVVERFAAEGVWFLVRNAQNVVDITHESLIRKWDKPQGTVDHEGWLQGELEVRDEYLELTNRAVRAATAQDLLSGSDLDRATRWRDLGRNEAWARRYTPAKGVFDKTLTFIADSEQQRRRQKWRLPAFAILGILIVATFVGVFTSRRRAVSAQEIAEERSRVTLAKSLIDKDPTRAGLVLLELKHPTEIFDVLTVAAGILSKLPFATTALEHDTPLRWTDASPDGQLILTVPESGHVVVWAPPSTRLRRPPLDEQSQVERALFSPDGKQIVTVANHHKGDENSGGNKGTGDSSEESTVQLWNLDGSSAASPVTFDGRISAVQFSSAADQLVAGSFTGEVRIWNTRPVESIRTLHDADPDSAVVSVAFDNSGSHVLAAFGKGTVRVWDTSGNAAVHVCDYGTELLNSSFIANSTVVTATRTGVVYPWKPSDSPVDVSSPTSIDAVTCPNRSPAAISPVPAVAGPKKKRQRNKARGLEKPGNNFKGWALEKAIIDSKNGQTAFIRSDGSIKIVAPTIGPSQLGRAIDLPILPALDGPVEDAIYTPSGEKLLVGYRDGTIRLWPISAPSQNKVLASHYGAVTHVAIARDGHVIVTASVDHRAQIFSDEASDFLHFFIPLQSKRNVTAVDVNSNDILLTASQNGEVRLWNLNGTEIRKYVHPNTGVRHAAFSPDGARLLSVANDGVVRIWGVDQQGNQPLLSLEDDQQPSKATCAQFSPDGARVVTGSEDGALRIWSAERTAEPVRLRGDEPREQITFVAFSPKGNQIIATFGDGTARSWQDGQPNEGLILPHPAGVVVTAASFTRDGERFVTAASDGARIWRVGEQQPRWLSEAGSLRTAVFSPDGESVLTAGLGGVATIFRLNGDGASIRLIGHDPSESIVSAQFSRDGRLVLTASEDQTARLWSIEGVGDPVVLDGHSKALTGAVFSAAGDRIITGSSDGKAIIWAIEPSRLLEIIRARTRLCLQPDFRQRYFVEDQRTAEAMFEACETALHVADPHP